MVTPSSPSRMVMRLIS